MAIPLGPRRDQGPLFRSRHPRPRTSGYRVTIPVPVPEAPFTEILIPEGNEGHEETGNKEERPRQCTPEPGDLEYDIDVRTKNAALVSASVEARPRTMKHTWDMAGVHRSVVERYTVSSTKNTHI